MTAVPDVSVVIPVYNGEGFLREAVESVLAQEGFSLQVIVVDNDSSDRTLEVAASIPGPVTVASEKRRGPAAPRNLGVRLATGKYLAFLDADDVWLPGKLARQIHALTEPPGADLVFTHCREFHDPGIPVGERGQFPCRPAAYPLLTASTVLMARETFLRAGEMPEIKGGEFIAWYGWTQALGMRAKVLAEVCAMRRVHAHNWSRNQVVVGGYPEAAKWVLQQKRQAQRTSIA